MMKEKEKERFVYPQHILFMNQKHSTPLPTVGLGRATLADVVSSRR